MKECQSIDDECHREVLSLFHRLYCLFLHKKLKYECWIERNKPWQDACMYRPSIGHFLCACMCVVCTISHALLWEGTERGSGAVRVCSYCCVFLSRGQNRCGWKESERKRWTLFLCISPFCVILLVFFLVVTVRPSPTFCVWTDGCFTSRGSEYGCEDKVY